MAITQISNNVILDGTILPAKLNVSASMRTFLSNATSANLASTVSGTTGTGNLVFANSPNLANVTCGVIQGSGGANGSITIQGTSSSTQTTSNVNLSPVGGGVTIGGTTRNASAIFQINSTTLGFLPPVMTSTQRNAISSPASGLVVYSSDLLDLSLYNGTAWGEVLTTHTASFTSDTLRTAVSDETGTGSLVFSTNPTFQGANVTGDLAVTAHFSAATKSFKIPHQTKDGYLQYGVVESNEHGVYVRGSTSDNVIHLPDHWLWLVDADSVTVTLTPVEKFQPLFVESSDNKKVIVGGVEGRYNYVIYGTRKDVEPLQIEIE